MLLQAEAVSAGWAADAVGSDEKQERRGVRTSGERAEVSLALGRPLCMERSGERKRGSGDQAAAFARSAFAEARLKPVRRAAVRALDQRRSVRNLPGGSWLLTI
jgi:hypothetical protein